MDIFSETHPATLAVLRYFEFDHLPEGRLQDVSSAFYGLAHDLVDDLGLEGPEFTVCLRKLLEAKDCAVRAALPTT
jgi:hypothetical protein